MERKCYKLASCALNSIGLKVYLQIQCVHLHNALCELPQGKDSDRCS